MALSLPSGGATTTSPTKTSFRQLVQERQLSTDALQRSLARINLLAQSRNKSHVPGSVSPFDECVAKPYTIQNCCRLFSLLTR